MAFGRLGTFGTGFGRLGQAPRTRWWFPDSSLDLDFAKNRARQSGRFYMPSALLTTTRASDAYADDVAGNWTAFSSNVPRITNKGLLVEGAQTNSIRNNSMQGAVAGVIGSGGALPTNWANNTTPTGITYTVSLASSLGVEYLALRVQGTPSASNNIRIAFDSTTQIVANTGETWALSMFLAILAGDLTNISSIKLTHQERDSGGASLRGTQGPDVKASLTSALARFSYAVAMGASTARDQPELSIAVTSGQAIDLTIAIGWPQLELGAVATSPIRTTSAAATRAADVITTAYSGSGSGSVVVYARTAAGVGTQTLWCWDDGTSSNRIRIYRNSSNEIHCVATVSSVDQCDLNLGTVAANTAFKVAFAWAANDFAATLNGGTVGTDASGSVPGGLTTIRHGSDSGGNYWNGLLTREGLFAARVASAQLQALTA